MASVSTYSRKVDLLKLTPEETENQLIAMDAINKLPLKIHLDGFRNELIQLSMELLFPLSSIKRKKPPQSFLKKWSEHTTGTKTWQNSFIQIIILLYNFSNC